MSPVLLDQRRLLVIIIGILCALVITFYSGYFAGIRHAEASRPETLERTELNLPAAAPEPVRSEAVKPAVVAPGADIDVDVPDATKPKTTEHKPTEHKPSLQAKAAIASTPPPVQKVVAKTKPADTQPVAEQKPMVEQKPVVSEKPAVTQEATAEQAADEPTAIDGATADAPEVEASPATAKDSAMQIVDDASRDDARYSIQIGIYGSENNASKQVDSLIAQHLSGYYETYQNQKDETRYRVRFGYFASRDSANRALEIWQKTHPGSSYLVRLLH